jgi:ABC-type multidrug transport system fused ATPase/permease subunit
MNSRKVLSKLELNSAQRKWKQKHLTPDYLRHNIPQILSWWFNGVVAFSISLSIFAALRPYLLKQTVDGYINQWFTGSLYYIVLMAYCFTLQLFSILFCFLAIMGQDIVKDIRIKLFKHILF